MLRNKPHQGLTRSSRRYKPVLKGESCLMSGLVRVIVFLALTSASYAQVGNAVVTGRVIDAAGAVVVNAEVQLKRLSTNEVFRTHTTKSGDYTVINLPVGGYEIRASTTGFKTEVRTGITLEVGQ